MLITLKISILIMLVKDDKNITKNYIYYDFCFWGEKNW